MQGWIVKTCSLCIEAFVLQGRGKEAPLSTYEGGNVGHSALRVIAFYVFAALCVESIVIHAT